MSPDYTDYKQFPSIKSHPWETVFPEETPALVLDLISKMLVYTPTEVLSLFKLNKYHSPGISVFYLLPSVLTSSLTNSELQLYPICHLYLTSLMKVLSMMIFVYTFLEIQFAQSSGLLEKLIPHGFDFKTVPPPVDKNRES